MMGKTEYTIEVEHRLIEEMQTYYIARNTGRWYRALGLVGSVTIIGKVGHAYNRLYMNKEILKRYYEEYKC